MLKSLSSYKQHSFMSELFRHIGSSEDVFDENDSKEVIYETIREWIKKTRNF